MRIEIKDEHIQAEWLKKKREEVVRQRDFAYYCFRVYSHELGLIGSEMGMQIAPSEGTPEDYLKEWKEFSEPAISKHLMLVRQAYDNYRKAEVELEDFDKVAAEMLAKELQVKNTTSTVKAKLGRPKGSTNKKAA